MNIEQKLDAALDHIADVCTEAGMPTWEVAERMEAKAKEVRRVHPDDDKPCP